MTRGSRRRARARTRRRRPRAGRARRRRTARRVHGDRADAPGDDAQREPGRGATAADRLAEEVDRVADDPADASAFAAIATARARVQTSEDQCRRKMSTTRIAAPTIMFRSHVGRRHRLQADHEEEDERDDIAHTIESDAPERSSAGHRRLAAQPPRADDLADANGQDVVAREAAEHHLVEAAAAGPAAWPRSSASESPAPGSRT